MKVVVLPALVAAFVAGVPTGHLGGLHHPHGPLPAIPGSMQETSRFTPYVLLINWWLGG